MNVKPGWPGVAAVRIGSQGIATRASQMRGRVWGGAWALRQQAPPPVSRSGDVSLDGLSPTPLWSSMVTRAIHRFEEITMVLIMLHFAVGTVAILLSE